MQSIQQGAAPIDHESQTIIGLMRQCLRRRKLLILSCLVFILVPIIAHNELTSPVYESEALIIFESYAKPLSSYERNLTDAILIANQLEEIKSFSFASEIVNSLPGEITGLLVTSEKEKRSDELDAAASLIQEEIFAVPVKKSNIIRISYRSTDPGLSREIVQTALTVLERRNNEIKQRGVSGAKEFLEKQLDHYKERLNASEEELRSFRIASNVTSLSSEAEEILRRITEAEVSYNSVSAERRSIEERLNALQERLKAQKGAIGPSVTAVGNLWAEELKNRLLDLNLTYMELENQGYDPDHPKLVSLRNEIEEIKADLIEKVMSIAEGEGLVDPLEQIQKYVTDIVNWQIELASLSAREKVLEGAVKSYNDELRALPDKEFRLTRLTRERDVNEKTYMLLLQKLEELNVAEADNLSRLRIVDDPRIPLSPVLPRKKLNLLIGTILGLLGGFVAAFAVESKKTGVRSSAQLELLSGWPVVATIPKIDTPPSRNSNRIPVVERLIGGRKASLRRAMTYRLLPNGVAAETFRMLRTNLEFHGVGTEYRNVLITSMTPADGKSTTLTNLAMAFAEYGKRTVIIDADLKRPIIHSIFQKEQTPGLTDILEIISEDRKRSGVKRAAIAHEPTMELRHPSDESSHLHPQPRKQNGVVRHYSATRLSPSAEDCLQSVIAGTEMQHLSAVTSGEASIAQHQSLASECMPILLKRLEMSFEIVLIDSPPLLLTSESITLASLADAVVLVVSAENFEREMLERTAALLKNANANVVGTVLNKMELKEKYKDYYKYRES